MLLLVILACLSIIGVYTLLPVPTPAVHRARRRGKTGQVGQLPRRLGGDHRLR